MPRDTEPFDERDTALLSGVAAYVRRQMDALEAVVLARVAADVAPIDALRARFEEAEQAREAALNLSVALHVQGLEKQIGTRMDEAETLLGEHIAAELDKVAILQEQTGRLRERIEERLAAVRDGVDGLPGEKGEPGEPGERGLPGDTGRDGSIAAVRAWREGTEWAGAHVAYQHRGGLWLAVADPEGAPPGTDDRWRCVANGIDGFAIRHDDADPRWMALVIAQSDDTETEFLFRMAIPLHRGLWAEGTTYERGDVVARNGASLMCVADTCTTPPGESDEWALMSSKGKPGSRGEDGARGLPGEKGEPGVVAGVADIGLEDGHLVIHKHDGKITLLRLASGDGNPETSIS